MAVDVFVADVEEGLLDVGGEGVPGVGVHGDEHGGGVADGLGVGDVADDFALPPALERLDGAEGALDDAFLQGVVGLGLRHADGGAAQQRDEARGEAGAADAAVLDVFEAVDGVLGGQDAGAVGVDDQELGAGEFAGLVLAGEGGGDAGRGQAVGPFEGQVEAFEEREAAGGVGEAAHAQVGDAAEDALPALLGLGQGAGGVGADFDAAVGSAGDFVGPGAGGLGLDVHRGEEDAVGEADGLVAGGGAAGAGGEGED